LSAELPEDARGIYLVADPPEEGGRRAKHELAEATRRLVEAVALLDPTDGGFEGLVDEVRAIASPRPRS